MSAHIVDSRGKLCPLPIIDLAAASKQLTGGDEVVLLADDVATKTDVPAWCRMKGHQLVSCHEQEFLEFTILLSPLE